MRIISGIAGGIPIKAPATVTRPSTDFVRQAIFSILGERVRGANVLDLFAGSGALGLEALSRGAASCCFVDDNRQACTTIGQNLEKSRLSGGRVMRTTVDSFLSRDRAVYDLIFADPPYCKHPGDTDHIASLLATQRMSGRLGEAGYLLVEASNRQNLPHVEDLELADSRKYGKSVIWFFCPRA